MKSALALFHFGVALAVGWNVARLGPFVWSAQSVLWAGIGVIVLLFGPIALASGAITWLVSPSRKAGPRVMALGAVACTAWAGYVVASVARLDSPRSSSSPIVGALVLFLLVAMSDLALGYFYWRGAGTDRRSPSGVESPN